MKARVQSSPLTAQVTLSVLALAAFSLVMVVGFGYYATSRADRDSLEKQKLFVADGIRDRVEAVIRQQQSVTVWDDTVLHARAHDQDWLAENVGDWMSAYYGHDRVYVLDANNDSIYAMQAGKTGKPALYEADRAAIEPTVKAMRMLIAEKGDGQGVTEKPFLSEFVSLGGAPAILAVQPIAPSTTRVRQQPSEAFLDVTVELIDQSVIDPIAERFLLSGARLLPLSQPMQAASVPLTDSRGIVLGYVGWDADRPGLSLIRSLSPALIAGLLLTAGLLAFLLRRLRAATRQLQQSQTAAQYLAFHDTLTGLPNRALFEDRLRRALSALRRDNSRMALLYLDLDRFKTVNDTLGHPVGDELVRQTAARLEKAVREIDTVARVGGDEFAIIITGLRDGEAVEELCRRLLKQIGQPFDVAGNQIFIGASIGVAIAPEAGSEGADLLRKADIALYEAKKDGRGRYQVFAGDMDEILSRKRMIENDLRAALTTGDQIKLLYQPVYAPDCRTILGAEALMRWEHPTLGARSPAQFVAIAEERGMIDMLGDWVLRQAASFAATTALPWVSVNISPLHLRDEGFPAHLLTILDEAGLLPSRLQLDITESILLENSDVTRTALATLRAAGVRIALDDFGTGYSSLNHLRRHAIDKLKIDRSFVRLLSGPAAAPAVVKALVDLARAMQVQVAAEGVETIEQRDALVAMGCHELQGFLFSLPLGPEQMRALGTGGVTIAVRKSATRV